MGEEEKVVNLIKDSWPQFQISKDDLIRPTQEEVVKFYSKFISEFNEKLAYLARVPVIVDNTGNHALELEEMLFRQLYVLLIKFNSLTFTLGDIYQPIRLRTKNFFKICIHFLAFVDNGINEIDPLVVPVFKAREDTGILLLQQQKLLQEIHEIASEKAEISDSIEELEHEYKSVENAYREMRDKKAAQEKLYAEKRNQIQALKCELESNECELNRLEGIEKKLLEEKITETEYRNNQRQLELLKSEDEILDSDYMNVDKGLVHENQVLTHSANCIRMLSNLEFITDSVKKQIKQEEQLKEMLNALEKLQAHINLINQQILDNEEGITESKEQDTNIRSEYKKVRNHYSKSLKQYDQELDKFKGEVEEKLQHNRKIISGHQEDITKLENDMERLRRGFKQQYIKVSEVEHKVMEKFKNTLAKYQNL